MKRTGKNLLKSMLAFVTTIALVLGALPIDGLVPVSQAEEPEAGQTLTDVSYLDKDGQGQTCASPGVLSVSGGAVVLSVSGDETVLSDSGSAAELTPGWYYVSEDIDFENSVILKGKNGESADYHIILADDVTMNIGTEKAQITEGVGLGCSDTKKTGINLSIYAQSTGDHAGQLNIYNGSNTTAINVDHLTINGGKVTAKADAVSTANAINANDFTINGGEVTANADAVSTANAINANNFTINGGKVTATIVAVGEVEEVTTSNAINANSFTINGGELTANGNIAAGASRLARANAITVNDFTIKDGKVTANAEQNGNGGWGSTCGDALYSTERITVNGGTIDAEAGGEDGNAIRCYSGCITVDGGSITAHAKGNNASGIKAGNAITINDGEVTAEALGGDNYGIMASKKITIAGGRVTAKGNRAGIYSSYSINGESPLYLSWRNATDFVETNSFLFNENRDVAIEPGKTFTTGSEKYYIAANASEVKRLTNVKLSASTDAVYAVTFDCGGYETVPATQIVKAENKVTTPPDPAVGSTYKGESFAGWYQDTACQIRYDFDAKVTSDLYLHAKWANKSTDIANASVKQIYRYTRSDIDPVVENNVGETLKKGTDYEVTEVTFKKSGETVSNMKEPGFYELTVTGKGTYSGSKTVRVCVLTFSEYNPETGELDNNATLPEGKDAAVVTKDTVTMNSGWYVVTDNVEVTSRIKVNGDVHLVLCDGETLNAAGEKSSSTDIGRKGISVTEGNSLTIYSQAGNTGKLIAKSNDMNYYAGIGGDCPADRTYNSATQSYTYAFPYLTGTENGNAGDITIHGGEIIARGSMYSAAIGKAGKSGTDGKGGRITIYGGKITAQKFGGVGSGQTDTGIGGRGADIHISHCRINDDFILSDGYQGSVTFDKHYVIEGATAVFVDSDNINEAAGKKILPVESTESHRVTFNSNGGTAIETQLILPNKKAVQPVTPIKQGYEFGGWYKNSDFSGYAYNFASVVTGDLTLYAKWTPVSGISYIGTNGQTITGFTAYSPMEADYTVLPSGSYYVGKDIILLERIKVEGVVNLILGDGHTLTAPMGISVMGEGTTLNILRQSGGTGKLSAIAASKEFYKPSKTTSDLLTGLRTLGYTATGDILSAIVASEGYLRKYEVSGNEIGIFEKIYSKANGLLSGLNNNAAIGGDTTDTDGGAPNGATGTINIYGGTINAWGGTDAAAIGGGKNNKNYGKIHIYGGDVAVLSGRLAAGIGSGFIVNGYGNDGAVGIYGGKVRVIPDSESTGIGGGKYAYGGDIRILGGQVEVKTVSNKSEAYNTPYWGIGDGYDYEGEKSLITLGSGSGDSVYAEGRPYVNQPGDGYNGIVRIVPKQVLQVSGDPFQKFNGEISNPEVISAKKLVHSHTHVFTYTASGGTLYATCSDSDCEQHSDPATLTLSAQAESDLVYDGTEKPVKVTGDYSISGYAPVYYQKKNGDTWGEKVTAAPKEAGTYLVSLTVEDEAISNPPTASVEYTIRKRDVTITGLTARDKIYDDTTAVTIDRTNMRLDNTVDGDDVRIVSGEAAFERPDAATGSAVVFTGYSLAGEAAGNYQLESQPTTLTATIMKRPVTIKAEDQIARCGGAIQEMAATFDQEADRGVLTDKGHELTALTLTPDPDPRNLTEPATGGTITPTGAVIKRGDEDVTANYDITYENGSLAVELNKAEVTKEPTAATGLKYAGYKNNQWLLLCPGEATTKMEYCVRFVRKGNGEWVKNEDETTLVKDNAAPTEGYGEDYSAWEAGTYYVYYRAAADDSHLPSEPGCITVEIGTVPLIVTVSDATITYGDKYPMMDVVASGFVAPGEKDHIGSLEYHCEHFDGDKDIWHEDLADAFDYKYGVLLGPNNIYGVKARYAGGDVTHCYDIKSVPGFVTVNPRTASLEWGSTSFTYDGEPHVPTVTVSNVLSEVYDQLAVDVAGAQVNAGQYTARVTSLSGSLANRYKLPTGNLTKVFSIEKADYTAEIPPVKLDVPVSATSFTASVAGKMPRDAGTLAYRTGTVTYTGTAASGGSGISGGDFVAAVDRNGLVTVTQIRPVSIPAGAKITVPVHVTSTNYNDKSITVEATFVGKSQAGITVAGDGVSIGADHTLSVEYDDNKEINLSATVDPSGTGGTWVWESSNPNAATVTGNGAGCKVNIIGGGTTGITAKYDDDTKTGQVTLFLTVNPKSIPIPVAREGLVYINGDGKTNVQTGVASEDEHVKITGGSDYRVGDHVATAVLSDPVTYRWSDGTTDVKYIPWRIEKMARSGVPTGLVGVAPTTWENKDGKIKANYNGYHLEYSTDENFRNAIKFAFSTVDGLTPGTYYVRFMEDSIYKAGPATIVVIDAYPVPAVRARQGLVYNGSAQALVETDASSRGKIYYAVTEKGYPEPAAGQYTTSIPTATASGSHFVWYKIVGNGNPNAVAAENMQVTIAKKEITVGGIKAGNKVYDGTKNAALDTSGVTLTGKAGGDKLGVTATGTFLSESVGTGIQVDISDLTLTGKDAANYFLAYGGQQKTTTANITARPISGAVTISGGTAAGIQAGDTLTATLAPANTSVSYQWLINEVEQDVATSDSFTFTIPAGTAVGAKISVRVSGKGNYAGSLTSSEIEIGKKTMGDAAVTVDGDGSVGAVLRATVDVGSSGMTGEDYSLVWCRDGVAIEDATGDTYTVDGADRGHTISVKVMAGGEFSGEIVSAGKAIPAGSPVIRAGASAGNAQATVSWTVDTAGQEISRYQVICVETGLQKLVEPGVSSCTFTGLTNGTAYSFIVTAVYGDSSVESDPTAAVRPTAPSSAGGGPSGTGGSGGGSGSGGGGSSGESGSGTDEPSGSPAPNEDPSASAAPGAGPEPGPGPEPTAGSGTTTAPTIVEQRTETTNNPDGTTTTTTTTTDSEGTKTVVAETVKTDGSVEKVTDVVKADGSTEKTTEISHPNGSSEKTVDIVKADGSTIHEEVKTTAKGKETATVVEVSPAGDRTVTESVTKPNGNYEKTTSETVVKKDEDGNIIGETTTIRTEEKAGKITQTATYQVVDSSKHVIKLTQATTTAKNGVVTIPKTVKADGTTYKITTLAKGMLKGGETKPKKVALQAGSIKTVRKGAFDNLAKKGTILIAGTKKQFKELKKLIEKSGLPKGVKVKRA